MNLFSVVAWIVMAPVYIAVVLYALIFNGWSAVWCILAFHIFSGICLARLPKKEKPLPWWMR